MSPDGWPVDLGGVVESVVTTLGPNDLWNVAALGLHAPDGPGEPVTATTWGRTRTWRNFRERNRGYVQFTQDPELFVSAALSIHEVEAPILPAAHAWVEVEPDRLDDGEDEGTVWVEWALRPVESAVESRVVPTFNRGYAAVIEATVHASRLDVDAYDTSKLVDRIEFCESVVDRSGGPPERRAFDALLDGIDLPE